MNQIDRLLDANRAYEAPAIDDARPALRLAVVTCMDARVDVLAALGLDLGSANVIRNAGGRVTEDVLRSLALASHVLGVDSVVLVQHTQCGLEGSTNAELQARTETGLDFLPIADHEQALKHDVGLIADAPYLSNVVAIAGFLYDTTSGRIDESTRWVRAK